MEPILVRQLEARFNAAKSCLARVARWYFKGRRHEAEAFEISGGSAKESLPPPSTKKHHSLGSDSSTIKRSAFFAGVALPLSEIEASPFS